MMKRLMANIAAFGMVGCLVLVMAGCGGSDSTKRELAQTKEDLAAAEEARMKAEAAAAEAARQQAAAEKKAEEEEAARQQAEEEAEEAARRQAEAEEEAEEAARQQAEAEEEAEEEEAARQRAEEAQRAAEAARQAAAREAEEARQQALNQEANQRAEGLKDAFGDLGDETEATSPVEVEAIRAGSLSLTHGGYRAATLSGTGVRSTTMALTSGGDSGKTVVYTDRELTRPLLEHYAAQRDGDDMTRFLVSSFPAGDLTFPTGTIAHPQTSDVWRITHRVPTSLNAVDGDLTDDDTTRDALPEDATTAKTADSYPGSLHGKSGSFVCGGDDGCQVTITPAYGSLDNGRFPLATVTVGVTGTGALRFKPSGSPTLQLHEGGPVGSDMEYMVFGYWREDPTSPAADYQVSAFAEAINRTDGYVPSGDFTATYDGTAVGMYVEQDPNNPVDTHRQGEFTADVHLEVDGAAAATISGTIDDFVTTPTGGSAEPRTAGRWLVRLGTLVGDPPSGVATGTTAYIDNLAGVKSGRWAYQYVQPHATAAADALSPAVTGTFDTRIEDFVHLIGAFGAGKR